METVRRSNVQVVLRDQGRSVAWFCRQVGIHRSVYYRMESGERAMPPAYRRTAARVLGVPEGLLFLSIEVPRGTKQVPQGASA